MGRWEKFHSFLGFNKSYNAILFCIFAFPFFTFILLRGSQCVSIHGFRIPEGPPGSLYWFQDGRRRLAISIHIAAIVPCASLMLLQFIPAIRQKRPLFHRINGRIVLMLLLTSSIGVLMIARRRFGGTGGAQTNVGVLVKISRVEAALSYYTN